MYTVLIKTDTKQWFHSSSDEVTSYQHLLFIVPKVCITDTQQNHSQIFVIITDNKRHVTISLYFSHEYDSKNHHVIEENVKHCGKHHIFFLKVNTLLIRCKNCHSV
jgi:hypothetical protein